MTADPHVVAGHTEPLWFLGTLQRIKLDGDQTGGRFALIEGVFPRGAAPPLHSHPQDETLYVIAGQLTAWVVDRELGEQDEGDTPAWTSDCATLCGAGAVVLAPGGVPHTFRVESDTLHALVLSTPAGIERYIRALADAAEWPWLPEPSEGPRVPADRMAAVERELGMVRHGPPPPKA